ncbi:hypothetical protein FOHLNKBM_4806 [Methylobacterium longum]|jgi:hypothetical protein|nr:hypothetical protein FOHLNKBM_4806 [Methylobacterium longum]
MRHRSALAMIALLCAADSAQAQTVLAPSGDSAVTQPGGTEGRAAQRNLREAIRNGDVVGAVPGPPRRAADEPVPLREDAPRRVAE